MGSILSMQWPISSVKQTRKVPPALLVAAGVLHQLRGRLAVLRGTMLHNDILRAQGHRQQLVGMLQRFWKKDRQSVEAWVDALLRRGTPAPPAKAVWHASTVRPILHQEM